MNKKKKWIITAIVLVVFCLILSLYNLLNDKAPASDDAAKAPIAPRRQSTLNVNGRIVRPQRLTDGITTVGNLLPDEEVDLSFETSGKIVAINFQEGTVVRKGELLAKVNDLPLVAQLSRYEAQLKLAEDRVYRQSALLKKDAVSQEAYEQARTELAMLNADIDIVKSNITKISPLKIDFFVPERYANQIKPGTRLSFTIEGRQERFEAAVYATESKVDIATRTLAVRAKYPNTRGKLLPGRFATVQIRMHEIPDAIAIPTEALVPEMGVDKVFLYKGGKAHAAEVKTGLRTDSSIQIIDGLNVGDTLITSGTLQLREGLPVKLDTVE